MTQADAAVAEVTDEETQEKKYRLTLEVDIQNVGPCRKHVRVKVPRTDIEHFEGEATDEIVQTAAVPGFRKGKVPARLARKRFVTEIADSVRQRVLMQSLEQLAEENSLDPINEPDFDVESLKIPEEGDFEYEFDVEVRPDFDIPSYDGLKIQRPLREVSSDDVSAYLKRFVSQYATLVDHDGPAEPGDFVVSSIDFSRNGEPYRGISSVELQLKPKVRFRDAEIADFDKLLAGSTTGTVKTVEVMISNEAEQIEMRGEKLTATITVGQVKRQQLPEQNHAFYERIGYADEGELRDEVEGMLRRQVTFEQRQECRRQVLDKITESATWELPESLVSKQTENALRREVLEMQQAGFTSQQILARENELRQKSISSTRQALKEHFVLDRIATKEKIEVTPIDIESEINMMAVQRGESPRKVRARLQKSGVIENLEAQIRERKAVDLILRTAQFEDVPAPKGLESDDVQALSLSVCGMSSVVVDPNDDDDNKRS
ncbi:MAG: trigger factor [Candidatus Saccharimonas sp.]|nr:trigger factor [Planctomycetaceae bacterium]